MPCPMQELTSAEIEEHVRNFGSNGTLNEAQFKELMIHLIGVIHTKEGIASSFRYLARDKDEVRSWGEGRLTVDLGFVPPTFALSPRFFPPLSRSSCRR